MYISRVIEKKKKIRGRGVQVSPDISETDYCPKRNMLLPSNLGARARTHHTRVLEGAAKRQFALHGARQQ